VKVSFFETVRYLPPQALPPEWPVPAGAYDPEAGARAYRGMIERLAYVEELGFDWVSVSEHHYSPRILSPSPIVSAAFIAAQLRKLTIALLGPIVPHSNPVRVAEELAMLDTMAGGRLVVGLLRGTANEAMTYDLNPVLVGTRDDAAATEAARRVKERVPDCHLVFVYDAGRAIAAERPEAFAEVVSDFLERHEAFVISRARSVIHP
jgi:alkanesulfonate monooxygenase SsuD/methylene tetrahydromethanopterin reductase-like flavin-dependent oxidoreductase (luciferase family)